MRHFAVFFLLMTVGLASLDPADLQAQSIQAVYSSEAENVFSDGLTAYRQGDFEAARSAFVRLLEYAVNQHSSAGQLLLGKSYFRLGSYEDALAAARGLQRKYADSRYVAEARLLAGDSYFKLKRYYEAAMEYGRLLATPAPLATQAQAAERLAAIDANGHISAKAMESVRLAVGAERMRESLLFGRARWYGRLGWEPEAETAAQAYRDGVGSSGIFYELVDDSITAAVVGEDPYPASQVEPAGNWGEVAVPTARVKLGLLLPLSGPYQRIANEIYAGVSMANEAAGEPFDLIVADTGLDFGDLPINADAIGALSENPGSGLLRVVQGARTLVERDVAAIIGPLFSSSCVAAAVVAEAAGVPMIAPLSQQSGLDSLGQFIFQINAIPETQGHLLAEHATLVLGLQNVVILSPLSDYGWNFERAFRYTAEVNGGRVVHSDWYVPNQTKDFRRVFEEIRAVGFELMPPPEDTLAVADSLEWAMTDSVQSAPSFLTELLEGIEGEIDGEAEEEEEAPPDSSEIFIETVDGIVVAVESFDDAKTIAPQISFYRLETQILGNDIWYDPEGVRQMRLSERKYVDGAIVASAKRQERGEGQEFVDSYRQRFGSDPQYAAYGYDAAQLVAAAWRATGGRAAPMRDWLSQVRDYAGVSGHISFAENRRTNVDLTLLKIDGDRFRPLGRADLPDLGIESDEPPASSVDLPTGEAFLDD